MLCLLHNKKAFIPIQKNASTALIKCLWHSSEEISRDILQSLDVPIVAMWRDPYERIVSAWRMFTYRETRYMPYRGVSNFSEWVIAVCDGGPQDDVHLMSQYEHSSSSDRWLPTRVIKWNFQEFSRVFDTPPILRWNVSCKTRVEWTAEARKALAIAYADDLKVWKAPCI